MHTVFSLIMVLFLFSGGACSGGKSSSDNPGPKPPRPASIPTPPPEDPPSLTILKPDRLLRRLTLDLDRELPTAEDVTAIRNSPARYEAIAKEKLSSEGAAASIADLHRSMWHLDSTKLPDLDRFINGGNTSLQSALTTSLRRKVVMEPLNILRQIFQNDLPLSEVFTSDFTIADLNVLSLWGLQPEEEPWASDNVAISRYLDGRPAVGILAANGFIASFDTEGNSNLQSRTAGIFMTLTCQNFEDFGGHEFSKLTGTELRSDLRALSSVKSPCAGCHGQYADLGVAEVGLGSPQGFQEWLTYSTPSRIEDGFYGGFKFTGFSGAADLLSKDPRVKECELKSLASELYQKPLNWDQDAEFLLEIYQRSYENEFRTGTALTYMFLSDYYRYSILGKGVSGALANKASGIKFLRSAHWRKIVTQLTGASEEAFAFPVNELDLDPGVGDVGNMNEYLPNSTYWHYSERLARQLASRIVSTELADVSSQEGRLLLTELPSGSGLSATETQVVRQMQKLWNFLTAIELEEGDTALDGLLGIWRSLAGGTDDSHRDAWQAVLTACLLSPEFLLY